MAKKNDITVSEMRALLPWFLAVNAVYFALLLVLFFACGLNYTMLLVCAGNFFLMGKSAEKSLRRGSGKSAQSYMNTMYCLRYLGLFLAMTAAAFVPFIDLICAAVPLFFPKIIITLRGLWENRTRRRTDSWRQ